MPPRILVAGIGNIFLGDDGFGVEVARRLARRSLPANVCVTDFGIRGFDLTMAMLEDFDLVILADAAPRGGSPGSVYVIEPELPARDEVSQQSPMLDPHSLDPVKVLQLATSMGGRPGRVLVVGCEPENVTTEADWDVTPGLSEPVARAVDQAIAVIESLIADATKHQLAQAALSFSISQP